MYHITTQLFSFVAAATLLIGLCLGNCRNQRWDANCTRLCPANCKVYGSYKCSQTTGECVYGCFDGYWGAYCNNSCYDHCENCGQYGPNCLKCRNGFWGDTTCPYLCPDNCKSSVCNQVSGICTGCENRFWDQTCNKTCSPNCYTCGQTSGRCIECYWGYWGKECNESCSSLCRDDRKCYKDTGHCVRCDTHYWGNGCTESCPHHCAYSSGFRAYCHRYFGYCDSCILGYWGQICNNTCTFPCRHCRQSDGYCLECPESTWGVNCTQPCPFFCQGQCDRATGFCSSCKRGFWGKKCDTRCSANCQACQQISGRCEECVAGYWGADCSGHCSVNCPNRICSITNGQCNGTCDQGYWGEACQHHCPLNCVDGRCNKSGVCMNCVSGVWGNFCEHNCHQDCLDCARINGYCKTCTPGSNCYPDCPTNCEPTAICPTGYDCTKCKPGFWGTGCSSRCNPGCKGGVCAKLNGKCELGCVGAFWGDDCRIKCPQCKVPEICQFNCSISEPEEHCLQTTGACLYGCADGFTGVNCLQDEDGAKWREVTIGVSVGGSVLVLIPVVICIFVMYSRKRCVLCPRNEKDISETLGIELEGELDYVCILRQRALRELSKCLTESDATNLLVGLGMTSDEIKIVRSNHPRDIQQATFDLLLKWRNRYNGDEATMCDRLIAELKAINKNSLAENLEECYKAGIEPTVALLQSAVFSIS